MKNIWKWSLLFGILFSSFSAQALEGKKKYYTSPKNRTYQEAASDLHALLQRIYPAFELKGIDWNAVGEELLPRSKTLSSDKEFGRLCMEIVARLQDSHAALVPGAAKRSEIEIPRWDPGFACLIDDRNQPVIYFVDPFGPARRAGIEPGMTVLSIDSQPAEEALQNTMKELCRYQGYSSKRYLRYHAARFFPRRKEKGTEVALVLQTISGREREYELPATEEIRYLPRLPVPIEEIDDSGSVSWTMLEDRIGYIYVRRINRELVPRLDQAVEDLSRARAIILDVRGNSGGGFDPRQAFRNFDLTSSESTDRPLYEGPMAMLIDSRCISAGEGWASWFIANNRAAVFGEATAGASARKQTFPVKNGLYNVIVPVKLYCGSLDRPIEHRGLEPDVAVRQNAEDLSDGRDTVLETARTWLVEQYEEN